MTTPIVGGLSLFVIARNFSARRGKALGYDPSRGFWALSRINIRECVQTPRVGGARWKAAGDTVGRRKRQEWQGRVKTNGRRREGTRWEHVSHTEIVNYSFVLRRVGVIWKRDGAGRGEYRGGMDGERRRYRGERERTTHMHTREWEIEGESERHREMPGCATRRGRENETMHFLFHRAVETHACHGGGGVGGCVVACARARGKTKNEDEVNDIHAGYRILPSRARPPATIFSPSFFFFPLSVGLPRSPPLTFSA